MSDNSKFFQAKIDESAKASREASTNWPFSMDKDEEVRIAFLNHDDQDVPPIHYHNTMHDGKLKRVCCTAAEHLGGHCHLCEYTKEQHKDNQWKTQLREEFCYTILDDRYQEGAVPQKKLRLSTVADHKQVKRTRDTATKKMGFEGLRLLWVEVIRPSADDKPARVGTLKQILNNTVHNTHEGEFDEDFLEPFTEDEILVQFITDPDEIAEISKEYPLSAVSTPKVREV